MVKILLAPMDGISDYHVRQLLTAVGGYDHCMTEFLRVTESVFPRRVFFQNCPEIDPQKQQNSRTKAGTPVSIQLLGNHPQFLAENAHKAQALGVHGIDLNFGCPSHAVNKHGSGAVLLQQPEKVYEIVSEVRKALDKQTVFSVKMRLGYEDSLLALENADAIAQAGADFITIHARTKLDAYRPPARWETAAALIHQLPIPVIMNGEIWSVSDYRKCVAISQCRDIMLARGAFAQPDLARQIRQYLQYEKNSPMRWEEVQKILFQYHRAMVEDNNISPRYISGRLKLWLKWLMASYEEAVAVFEQIKTLKNHNDIIQNIVRQDQPN